MKEELNTPVCSELEYVKDLLRRLRANCVEPWLEASFCDVRAEIDHYFLGIPDVQFVAQSESMACSKCGKTPPFPGGTRCQDLQCPLINWAQSATERRCPYCTSDNEGIRSTYYDQTCEGCVKRMVQK